MTVPKFGEPPAEQGELPTSYGRNRLVLLPVEPYLIHVYWDLDSIVPPAAGARPILRFHESLADQARPFDVDIDFTSSSWYVNLWSPGKVYFADAGWLRVDGSFLRLARSNTVQTPPAWPRKGHAPVAARVTATEPEPQPDANVEPAPVAPHPDASAQFQRKLAEIFSIRAELPPVPELLAISFELADPIPGEPSRLDTAMPEPTWPGVLPEPDLTQLSEERFTPGVSSARDPLGS